MSMVLNRPLLETVELCSLAKLLLSTEAAVASPLFHVSEFLK